MSRVQPKSRLSGDERGVQLLDIAEKLFTERGYEGVSVEDIAQAAGVTRPIIYKHHGGKDGIFLACVARARQAFEDGLRDAVDQVQGGDMLGVIDAGGRAFFDMLATDARRWTLLFATSASIGGALADQLTDMRFRTVATIVEVARPLATGVEEERLEAFAHAISGIGEQLGRWWLRKPDMSEDRLLEHYRTLVAGAAMATLATA